MEQAMQQAPFRGGTRRVTARCCHFATASRFDDFAAANRLGIATGIMAAATQMIKQAKRTGVDRARRDQGDGQQSRNENTTHRDISMELGFGKVLPRISRNTSERPRPLEPTPSGQEIR